MKERPEPQGTEAPVHEQKIRRAAERMVARGLEQNDILYLNPEERSRLVDQAIELIRESNLGQDASFERVPIIEMVDGKPQLRFSDKGTSDPKYSVLFTRE